MVEGAEQAVVDETVLSHHRAADADVRVVRVVPQQLAQQPLILTMDAKAVEHRECLRVLKDSYRFEVQRLTKQLMTYSQAIQHPQRILALIDLVGRESSRRPSKAEIRVPTIARSSRKLRTTT